MPTQRPLLLPIAVLVALCIIGAAAFFALRPTGERANEPLTNNTFAGIPPIDKNDWVFGNPNAPIVYVVYSDFECPYCKSYHETMHRLMDTYGRDGKVAWVFRHIPFVQLHSKAPTEALASECVGDIGGNDAFWSFANTLFSETPSNDQFDLSLLPGMAERAGVSRAEFEACMRSDRLMRRVQEDFESGTKAGATGSPFTIVLVNNQQVRIEGAQIYPAMVRVMEMLLSSIDEPGLVAPGQEGMVDDVFSDDIQDSPSEIGTTIAPEIGTPDATGTPATSTAPTL